MRALVKAPLAVVAALGLVALGGTAALAQWTTSGSGSGSATTTTINPPSSASAAGDSSSSVLVSVTAAPASGAPVHGYRVDRTAPTALTGACFITGTTGSCSAAAGSTGQQTYRVVSYRGTTSLQYWQSTPLTGVTGTPLSALVIDSTVVRDGGQKKVHFTGTGAVSGSLLTVTICKANSFPCSSGNSAGTSTVNPSASGAWTSGQSSTNLNDGTTYYAQAAQGTTTSPVLAFTVTGL
jgi:hypothetical protein